MGSQPAPATEPAEEKPSPSSKAGDDKTIPRWLKIVGYIVGLVVAVYPMWKGVEAIEESRKAAAEAEMQRAKSEAAIAQAQAQQEQFKLDQIKEQNKASKEQLEANLEAKQKSENQDRQDRLNAATQARLNEENKEFIDALAAALIAP